MSNLLGASVATSTRKKYDASWKFWLTYATKHGMTTLPAAPTDVALFLANLSKKGKKSVCSSTAAAAISWHHTSKGFPSPCNSSIVKSTLAGVRRTFSTPIQRMEPITIELLANLVSRPCSSLDDWQFTFYCIISFFGLFRFNDISKLRVEDFHFELGNLKINLDSSKTDQYRSGSNIYLSRNPNNICLCPVNTATAYLSLLAGAGASASTFVLADTRNLQLKVTHAVMLKKLRQALKHFVKLPNLFGLHSFRSGELPPQHKRTCLESS